jgi:hypothetical protein
MIAGDNASHATAAFDDFSNTRRLTRTVFMVHPPGRVLCAAINYCGRSASHYSQM